MLKVNVTFVCLIEIFTMCYRWKMLLVKLFRTLKIMVIMLLL